MNNCHDLSMIFKNQLFSHNRDKIWYISDLLKKYDKSRFYANVLENRENRGDSHDMGCTISVLKKSFNPPAQILSIGRNRTPN